MLGAVNVYTIVSLMIVCPLNIIVAPLEFVYSAKLWGMFSLLAKFIVTLAPAGTVIVLLSKARLSATRSMVQSFLTRA